MMREPEQSNSDSYMAEVNGILNREPYIGCLTDSLGRLAESLINGTDPRSNDDPFLDAFSIRPRGRANMITEIVEDFEESRLDAEWLRRLGLTGTLMRIVALAETYMTYPSDSPMKEANRMYQQFRCYYRVDRTQQYRFVSEREFFQTVLFDCFCNALANWFARNPDQVKFYIEMVAFEQDL